MDNEKLAQSYKNAASPAEKDKIFKELVQNNAKMLSSLAKKTWHDPENVSFKELIHLAMVALFYSVTNYNPKKGVKFSTYAYTTIKNYLNEEVRNSDLIIVSHYLRKKGHKRCEFTDYDDEIRYNIKKKGDFE